MLVGCLGGEAMDLCDRASCQISASSDHLAAGSPRETGADTDMQTPPGHKCSREVARLLHMDIAYFISNPKSLIKIKLLGC